jgi:hypothetical protein
MDDERCSQHPDRAVTVFCLRFHRRFCELDFQDPSRPVECLSSGQHCQDRPCCILWMRLKDEMRRRRLEPVIPPPVPEKIEPWVSVFRGKFETVNILMVFLLYDDEIRVKMAPAESADESGRQEFQLLIRESDARHAADIVDFYLTKWYPHTFADEPPAPGRPMD